MLCFIKWEDRNLNWKRLRASLAGDGNLASELRVKGWGGWDHSTVSFAAAQCGFVSNVGAIK